MSIAQFGIGSQPTYLPPIVQSLQVAAQQLQQLQQLNYVQQQQLQQLQQWVHIVPQQIQQLQQQQSLGQQSPFGVPAPGLGRPGYAADRPVRYALTGTVLLHRSSFLSNRAT